VPAWFAGASAPQLHAHYLEPAGVSSAARPRSRGDRGGEAGNSARQSRVPWSSQSASAPSSARCSASSRRARPPISIRFRRSGSS